jgi:hypothetical protein
VPELKFTPLNLIDNDSYLMIVYKDFDSIIVNTYSEKDKVDTEQVINTSASVSKTNTGQKLLKLVSAGVTSSIAQSMASKISLPNSVKGRIQSSLYDIVADGKISKLEVAEDFIGSCTNELDSTAIAMGFPTSQALYEAIGPEGAGVISQDFLKQFQKKAEIVEGEKLAQRNKVAQDLTVLKFKLVTGDSESWPSNLPSRKTEKGFDIVDAIENENKTRDFQISIIQGDYSGITDMYQVKTLIDEEIRTKKIPFDIYVNDKNNKKQEALRHCFFTGIDWESEGVNCLNANISITQIPEYEVKTEQVEGNTNKATRKQVVSEKNKVNNNKTKKTNKTTSEKKSLTTDQQTIVDNLKKLASKKKQLYIKNFGTTKGLKYYDAYLSGELTSRLRSNKITQSYSSLGFK